MTDRGCVSARKRGHQHHPKHQGTRRSNVPADEVIAVLRADLPVAHQELLFGSVVEPNNNHTEVDHTSVTHCLTDNASTIDGEIALPSTLDDVANNNDVDSKPAACVIESTEHITDAKADPISPPVLKKSRKSKSTRSPSIPDILGSNNSLNTSTTSSTKSRSSTNDSGKPRKKRSAPREERPPIEGAADDDSLMLSDIENDPELAEWSMLRCTSERTEVVAEREHRRQNRRCADYPGLAFGRSIFSSDTMMKFNIIRNELHNIMNTQLKRVRT